MNSMRYLLWLRQSTEESERRLESKSVLLADTQWDAIRCLSGSTEESALSAVASQVHRRVGEETRILSAMPADTQ